MRHKELGSMLLANGSQHTQAATLENPVPPGPVASIHTHSMVLSCGFDIVLDTHVVEAVPVPQIHQANHLREQQSCCLHKRSREIFKSWWKIPPTLPVAPLPSGDTVPQVKIRRFKSHCPPFPKVLFFTTNFSYFFHKCLSIYYITSYRGPLAMNFQSRPLEILPRAEGTARWGGSAEESLSQLPGPEESFPWPPRFKITIINDNL